jgi:glycosyltransferase involved in cell wall biosynthesis
MRGNHIVIGIYYHPEVFPPTLNAVSELTNSFDYISIIYRPNVKGTWKYPANVIEIPSGNFISSIDQENSGAFRKIIFFSRFVYNLLFTCLKTKPRVILLYDTIALLAYRLVRPFLFFVHKVWYHNHDIAEIERTRKFSIGWFACKTERVYFKRIDLFTLPTSERLRFFNIGELKGEYFILPNYPSRKFYNKFYTPKKIAEKKIKLIFQGRISEGHGLEEIIQLLKCLINEKQLKLILKGYCSEEYKNNLLAIAADIGVSDEVEFIGFTPYEEVPLVTERCDIGIAIFSKTDAMNTTLGKASNKIYEYAALGLPVIYLKNSGVGSVLNEFEWAIPVMLTNASINAGIEKIMMQYEYYSRKAYTDFNEQLNFEFYFEKVRHYLESSIAMK